MSYKRNGVMNAANEKIILFFDNCEKETFRQQ